jgi:uncharacterized protein (TIGR02147 family)
MEPALVLQQLLRDEYAILRRRNPAYSLRAFAKKTGLSSAALSEILNGKRRASIKIASRIADRLGLDPKRKDALLSVYPQKLTRKRSGQEIIVARKAMQLSLDEFRLVSEWHHFAILSLAEIAGFKGDATWVSRRLGIRMQDAQSAMERMERLGMFIRNAKGELIPSGQSYTSSDGVSDASVRSSHAQDLELLRKSIEEDDIEKRDFTAVTMAIDPDKLPEARKRIRRFRDEICQFLESGDKKEVYKLCIQTIPLSKENK